MLFHFACGGPRRPDHNQLSQRAIARHTFSAVPLGCGQLRAGVALPRSPHPLASPALPPVVRVKRLSFRHYRIRQSQQLVRTSTARHFRRLARCSQSLILPSYHWIVACSTQRCHIQGGSQARVSSVPNLPSSAHTCARLSRQRHHPGVGGCRFGRHTGRKVQRADQQPGACDQPDTFDAPQQCGTLCPSTLLQHRRNLRLQRLQLPLTFSHNRVQSRECGWDRHWPLLKRMALIACLLTHRQQAIAHQQPLAQLVIDLLRRCPARRLTFNSKQGQQLSIKRIGFGAPGQRAAESVDVGGIDDTDRIASLVKRDRQRDPVAASGFEHNQRLGWRDSRAGECGLEGGKALRSLGKGTRTLRRRASWAPGRGEGGGSNVDADKQAIVRSRCIHRSPKLKRKSIPRIAPSFLVIRGQSHTIRF